MQGQLHFQAVNIRSPELRCWRYGSCNFLTLGYDYLDGIRVIISNARGMSQEGLKALGYLPFILSFASAPHE